MKNAVFVFFFIVFLKGYSQEFYGLNYFHNLSYHSSGVKNYNSLEVDASSVSLFSRLPVSVNANQLFVQASFKDAFSVSGFAHQSRFGKNQSVLRVDGSANYSLKLSASYLTLGAGIKSFTRKHDETQLKVDFNENSREIIFGTEFQSENSLVIPLGVSFSTEKIHVGSYYGVGLNRSSTYGIYARALAYKNKVKEAHVKDIVSVAVYKEIINPKITLENRLEIENVGLNFFFVQNLNSNSVLNNSSVGAGFFYLWKLFNVNYQVSTNRNSLGLNHQLGIQAYLPR